MPIRRRRTTKTSKPLPPIPLCEGCGYATVFTPSRLMNRFKPPKVNISSTPLCEATPRDASVISKWLPQARRDLTLYTRELDRLRSRLLKLEDMRDNLQQRIDHHASLVAPVARLPAEVLQMIFRMSIPDDSEGPHHRKRGVSLMYPAGRTALRLALVCSRWRSVALASPEMWSYINVSILSHRELGPILELAEDYGKFRNRDELAQCMEAHPIQGVLKLYLERSQDHPLAIHLSCPLDFESTPECVMELSPTECICDHFLSKVFKIFCAHSHRWRSGHINLAHGPQPLPRAHADKMRHDDDEMEVVAELKYSYSETINVPLLEVLDIYLGPTRIQFSETPRLHTLRLTAMPWGRRHLFDSEIISAPVLRSLTLRKYSAYDLGRILPKLADRPGVDVFFELPYKERYSFRSFLHRNGTYTAPAVKSLLVDGRISRTLGSLDKLLESLTAPNATRMEFVLGYRKQATEFPHKLLVGMIKLSAMPLTILKFDGFYMPTEGLVDILKLLPTIEVFELVEGSIGEVRRMVRTYREGSEDPQWRDKVCSLTCIEETFICSNLIRELTLSSFLNGSHSHITPLLPNLTSLKLKFRPACSAQDLKNMVYSRRRDLELPASNTIQSRLGSESVIPNSNTDSTRSAGGLTSLKLVLIMDTLILDNLERAGSTFKEYERVIKELKDEGLDAQMRGINNH